MFAAEHSRQHLHSRIGKYRNLHCGVLYQKCLCGKGIKKLATSLIDPIILCSSRNSNCRFNHFPTPIWTESTATQPRANHPSGRIQERHDFDSTIPHPWSYNSDSTTRKRIREAAAESSWSLGEYAASARSDIRSTTSLPPHKPRRNCRASSTQRSRSRVTLVIFPATPWPVPSKNRQMFNFQDSHFGKTDLFSQNAKRPFYNAFVGCVPTDLMRDAS